jgi:hypothetical protein
MSFSESVVTGSPFQAWRAGFREGVKMTLLDGVKVPPMEIQQRIWWHNIHRLRMWSTVGAHEQYGEFAVLGARMGTYMANCTDWNYVDVRDFEILRQIYNEEVKPHESDTEWVKAKTIELGDKIALGLGLHWANYDPIQSKNVFDIYNETIELCRTYFRMPDDV